MPIKNTVHAINATLTLATDNGCFDLQFRKDTRHERPNSPTYYRWRTQFVITASQEKIPLLRKAKRVLGCGNVHIVKDQARFSVQNINDLIHLVVPFFKKHPLSEKKKKDFGLWQKAVEIIYRNKGKHLSKWNKNDALQLIEIHKACVKYKQKPKKSKWMATAQNFVKTM